MFEALYTALFKLRTLPAKVLSSNFALLFFTKTFDLKLYYIFFPPADIQSVTSTIPSKPFTLSNMENKPGCT